MVGSEVRASADAEAPAETAEKRVANPTAGTLPGAAPPVAVPYDAALQAQLDRAWKNRRQGYRPRTKHLHPDGTPRFTNRLFLSPNPYLQQHAHNPVNWYPWGDEAFDAARRLGRPVLLSVGYSTCHWCHVMEEESFEDVEIARFLNEHYVAVKVDREERPDIDAIYMSAVQQMTGRGGWPMTVWLTPEREPFHGGTYFPARDGDRGTRTGFLTLLRRLADLYREDPNRIVQVAARQAARVRSSLSPVNDPGGLPGGKSLQDAVDHYARNFDRTHGGMTWAPKFPSHVPVRFLLRFYRRTGSEPALAMAVLTLEKMAAGGMYDHVGGGFHRYSTDARWLVPHFEKMLYDNALLAVAYLEAYQVTRAEDLARVARETLDYVRRDMTSPQGGFYSATDADSLVPGGHREEGWFFTWTPKEIADTLAAEQARAVGAYYAVTPSGNFEGRNILNTPRSLEAVAGDLRMPAAELRRVIDDARPTLYEARARRPPPLRDEKILAAWNGLMISAFARGAFVLDEPQYAATAERAADFVLSRMRDGGRLSRSYKDGRALHTGYLDDYAFLVAGLLDLYEVTARLRWLEEAIALDRVLAKHYEDKTGGCFFMTSDDHEKLLVREKPSRDGAEPSGNSVHALNLLRLQEFTLKDEYRERSERCFRAFADRLERSPSALAEMLLAVDYYLDTPKEIVIVTPASGQGAAPLREQLRRTFVPNRIVSVTAEGSELDAHAAVVPLLRRKVARDGKATAYVCEKGVCALPTTDPAVFARQIAKTQPLQLPAAQTRE
jgi:uncharacterized protein YyaL (SSP411 family)